MKRIHFDRPEAELRFPFRGGEARLRWKAEGEDAKLFISLPYRAAYGMGEKYDALNQKGRTAVNRVEEKFCRQGEKTYCPAPFFLTDTGFGLFAETDCPTQFSFGETIAVSLPARAGVVLFDGSPETIISEYMALLGPARIPPKWAFGPWISANHWDSQEKAERQMELLRKYRFPATVLVLEAWSDESTFYIFNGAKYKPVPGGAALRYSDFDFSGGPWPDPRGLTEDLHGAGLHLVLWQAPVYKKLQAGEPENAQNENDRSFAAQNGLCVRTQAGEPYRIPEGHWFAGSIIPDFTNPETKKHWFAKRKYLLDLGVDGFKTDGGEFVCRDDLRFFDGSDGKRMRNRYAQSYTQAYTEFIGENRVLFSRAGYAGQHGTPILWAGDQQSENGELKSVLRAGLSAAMTGIPFWGFDIAGFAGPLPSLDLYRRATQAACFCPVMQWHSEPDGGQFRDLLPSKEGDNERSPWNLAAGYGKPEFVEEMRFWHNLRMNLLPYLYSTALECAQRNRPMLRPLVYAFPSDEAVRDIEDEFLLGDSLLAAPLTEENAAGRSVYLPAGTWYGFFTGKAYRGGQRHEIACEGRLPVFLRGGYGVALNLDDSLRLGGDVGSRTDRLRNLCFFLAGESGAVRFRDDLGNDFALGWKGGEWSVSGEKSVPLTVRVFQ